jgi:hypothetical protein
MSMSDSAILHQLTSQVPTHTLLPLFRDASRVHLTQFHAWYDLCELERSQMSGLRNDAYLQRFWGNCPEAVIERLHIHVILRATGSLDPRATDEIMPGACDFPWYQNALPSDRRRYHSLVGHFVLITRDYVVARTRSGRPRILRSKRGPHKTFTMQVPRRPTS